MPWRNGKIIQSYFKFCCLRAVAASERLVVQVSTNASLGFFPFWREPQLCFYVFIGAEGTGFAASSLDTQRTFLYPCFDGQKLVLREDLQAVLSFTRPLARVPFFTVILRIPLSMTVVCSGTKDLIQKHSLGAAGGEGVGSPLPAFLLFFIH